MRTPCLVANTNNNRTIPHHGNYVCPGWHEFTMQIWGGVIVFWESISVTATNIPAPLLSTWPEHPLIILPHPKTKIFMPLVLTLISFPQLRPLQLPHPACFPSYPVCLVFYCVLEWCSHCCSEPPVVISEIHISLSFYTIQNKWEIKWNIIENIVYIKSSSLLWEGQILSVVFLFITVD